MECQMGDRCPKETVYIGQCLPCYEQMGIRMFMSGTCWNCLRITQEILSNVPPFDLHIKVPVATFHWHESGAIANARIQIKDGIDRILSHTT